MDWELLPVVEFTNYSKKWQDLNKKLTDNLPILEPDFIAPLIHYFAHNNEILAIGKINNTITAIGIFQKINFFTWQSFQPSQAPVGLWLCPKNYTTLALKSLIKKLPGFILKIDVLHQDPNIIRLVTKNHIEIIDYIKTGKLNAHQSFETYFQSLGKNQRQNYNKANNRLIKQKTEVKFDIVTDDKKIHQAVEEYGRIESMSWKNTLGTSVNINNQQGQFYDDMLSKFAKNKNAQIWKYFYNEKLVAIDLCIKNTKQLIILKTTFDNEFSRYSPAINMKIDALKILLNDKKLEYVEFFGKTLPWHQRLNSIDRTMYHFSFYRYPLLLNIKQIFVKFKTLNRS